MTTGFICRTAEEYALTVGVRLQSHQVPFGADGDIEITDLYADTPGQGDGTLALQNLCDLADEYNRNLYLHPECECNKAYYARFGFVREEKLRYVGLQLVRYSKPEDEK